MKIEVKLENLKKDFRKYFCIVRNEYRVSDKADKFYQTILKYNKDGLNKLLKNDEYLSLIYFTLDAWNMNQREAKLKNFKFFKKSVLNIKRELFDIQNKIFYSDKIKKEELEKLFNGIDICVQESKLVAHSKTLHFLLPNVFFPIDNRYTLKIFSDSKENFEKYFYIHQEFNKIYNDINIKKIINEIVNEFKSDLPITKIFDNAVIGYIIYKEHIERNEIYPIRKHKIFYAFNYNENGERIKERFFNKEKSAK
jgi:hypothetical protein